MKKLETHYNREDGTFLIEIKLKDPRQLFHSLDPAPFMEKDLDEKAEEYIVEAVREFSLPTPLKLIIYLPEPALEDPAAADLPGAIRNYFEYRSEYTARQLRHLLRQGRASLIIGLVFLFFCITARRAILALGVDTTGEILEEGLLISGWVAMWRPIQLFLYDWWPIRAKRRVYDKIRNMPIEVRSRPTG